MPKVTKADLVSWNKNLVTENANIGAEYNNLKKSHTALQQEVSRISKELDLAKQTLNSTKEKSEVVIESLRGQVRRLEVLSHSTIDNLVVSLHNSVDIVQATSLREDTDTREYF